MRLALLVLAPFLLQAQQSTGDRPQLTWEGEVNDSCTLTIRGSVVQATGDEGQPVSKQHHRFRAKLPEESQSLHVQVLEGRGTVRVTAQPSLENNYTATIRIDDPQAGSAHYAIAVRWDVSPYDEAMQMHKSKKAIAAADKADAACCTPSAPPNSHPISWSGHVDGTVRVTIRGGSSYSQIVAGDLTEERSELTTPLPHRADLKYEVTKKQGGGEVQLVESPSAANGYALTFEVRNGQSTSSDYAVEISWAPQPAAIQPPPK